MKPFRLMRNLRFGKIYTCIENASQGTLEAIVQRSSAKKGVLVNFSKFAADHLCQRLFFNELAGRTPVPGSFFK